MFIGAALLVGTTVGATEVKPATAKAIQGQTSSNKKAVKKVKKGKVVKAKAAAAAKTATK